MFEVVIADNGSTDGTEEALARLRAPAARCALRVVRLDRNQGPAGGRNAAWRATTRARGRVHRRRLPAHAAEWLEQGLAAMQAGEPCVVVGRTIPDPADRTCSGKPFTRVVQNDDARFFATCNVFYRRADLDAVDGFDEAFATPAGEDTDLGLRVREHGTPAVFATDAVGVPPGASRQLQGHAPRDGPLGRPSRASIAQHPDARRELLHRRYFWKRSHPPVIVAVVGLAAALRWPPALLLTLPWLRYRLVVAPACPGPRRRVAALPGTFVVDALEVAVMARGSVREHVLVM